MNEKDPLTTLLDDAARRGIAYRQSCGDRDRREFHGPGGGQGRMISSELPDIDGPTIVCTQAGNINTGAFDPIADICAAAKPHGAWVHVDGAFGLWAEAYAAHRSLTTGMQQADSWATDAHKSLSAMIAVARRLV